MLSTRLSHHILIKILIIATKREKEKMDRSLEKAWHYHDNHIWQAYFLLVTLKKALAQSRDGLWHMRIIKLSSCGMLKEIGIFLGQNWYIKRQRQTIFVVFWKRLEYFWGKIDISKDKDKLFLWYFEKDWNFFGAKLIYQAASMFGYWQYLFTKNFRKPRIFT